MSDFSLPPIDLPGVRIYYDHIDADSGKGGAPILVHRPFQPSDDPDKRSPSDFSILFRSIIPVLHNFTWLYHSDNFYIPTWEDGEWPETDPHSDEFCFDELHDACYWAKPGFMEDWAPYLRDDGDELYGLGKPIDVEKLAGLYLADKQNHFNPRFLEYVDILFENYDGIYWACYARDRSLLDAVKDDWAECDRVKVVDTTWHETILMHEKEWEEWRRSQYKVKDRKNTK